MSDNCAALARRALPLIDLTSLNEKQDDDIAALCAKARTPEGPVAAVCTWPCFMAVARERLAGSGIRLATVVNFPDGGDAIESILDEIQEALGSGADEVDLVMPFKDWLTGRRDKAQDVIAAAKEACAAGALLKVILETGVLGSAENIAAASRDAIESGADFLKTSTGKRQPGATLDAAEVMLGVIREGGGAFGFKAAGGIRTTEQAGDYLALADRLLGPDWVTPERFRFGASGLLDDILARLGLMKMTDQKSDY